MSEHLPAISKFDINQESLIAIDDPTRNQFGLKRKEIFNHLRKLYNSLNFSGGIAYNKKLLFIHFFAGMQEHDFMITAKYRVAMLTILLTTGTINLISAADDENGVDNSDAGKQAIEKASATRNIQQPQASRAEKARWQWHRGFYFSSDSN